MTFFAILISLFIERVFLTLHDFRQFGWFHKMADWYQQRIGKSRFSGTVMVILVILPVLLLVILATELLDGLLFNFFTLIFGIVVLFLCLGPRDLDTQVTAIVDAWKDEDNEAAEVAIRELLGAEIPADERTRVQRVIGAILVQGNERIVSVLFWFVVLGPVGAVLYRLSCELFNWSEGKDELGQAAKRLHDILVWIPSRLSALGYAISGSFVDAAHNWRERAGDWADDWQASVHAVLLAAGTGALLLHEDQDDESFDREHAVQNIQAAMALVWRTVIVWLLVIALMTLSGWISS